MAITAWRLVKEKHAGSPLSGEGAAKFGGRWNSRGTPIAYSSASRALAALELLVHLNPPLRFRFKVFSVHFPEDLVERLSLADLPTNWRHEPASPTTRQLGNAWASSRRSPVLVVPSIIIPEESNYLINPLHPDSVKIAIGPANEFDFDPRGIE